MQKMIILSNSYCFYVHFFTFWTVTCTFFIHYFLKINPIDKKYVLKISIFQYLLSIYLHDAVLWLYFNGFLQTEVEVQKNLLSFKTDLFKVQYQNDVSDLVNQIKKLRAEDASLSRYQFLRSIEIRSQIERLNIKIDYTNLMEILKKEK